MFMLTEFDHMNWQMFIFCFGYNFIKNVEMSFGLAWLVVFKHVTNTCIIYFRFKFIY